jgi:SAM-dependent methyltransferase
MLDECFNIIRQTKHRICHISYWSSIEIHFLEIPMSDASFPIQTLIPLQEPPAPFTPGEPHFWTDPHIARQMLAFHLDPGTDAASRRPETIQRTVEWLVSTLALQPGMRVLDLGCGPGLYTARLADAGLQVTGVDFSQSSIDYARQQRPEIEYLCQNYLDLQVNGKFDAVFLVYGDFCVLSPQGRASLLANVRGVLQPGGAFVLDVTTPVLRRHADLKNGWYAAKSGFWKPGPHLVLEQGFAYPEDLFLDQYTVIEENGKVSVYRNWFQDYTPGRIREELESQGFGIQSLWSDLCGTPLGADAEWIGVIAH